MFAAKLAKWPVMLEKLHSFFSDSVLIQRFNSVLFAKTFSMHDDSDL